MGFWFDLLISIVHSLAHIVWWNGINGAIYSPWDIQSSSLFPMVHLELDLKTTVSEYYIALSSLIKGLPWHLSLLQKKALVFDILWRYLWSGGQRYCVVESFMCLSPSNASWLSDGTCSLYLSSIVRFLLGFFYCFCRVWMQKINAPLPTPMTKKCSLPNWQKYEIGCKKSYIIIVLTGTCNDSLDKTHF